MRQRATAKRWRSAANHAPALLNLGNILAGRGRYDEAVTCYEKLLAVAPQQADALNNYGNALGKLGRHGEALARFDRSLAQQPDNPRALINRASVLKELRRYADALADYQSALALDPNYADAHYNLGNALIDLGRPEEAVQSFRRALVTAPDLGDAHTSLIFAMNFEAATTTADQQAERARWARRYAALTPAPPHANSREPERRLRVDYVTPYFRGQAATYSFGGVIVNHDGEQFDVVCYSDTQTEDEVTKKLRAAAGLWRRTQGISDDPGGDRAHRRHRHPGRSGRPHERRSQPLFARKPAPVQVTAWASQPKPGCRRSTIYSRVRSGVRRPNARCSQKRVFDYRIHRLSTPGHCPNPGASGRHARRYYLRFVNRFAGYCRRCCASRRRFRARCRSHGCSAQGSPVRCSEQAHRCWPFSPTKASGRAHFFLDQADRAAHFAAYRQLDIALDPLPPVTASANSGRVWIGVPVVTSPGRGILGARGCVADGASACPTWSLPTSMPMWRTRRLSPAISMRSKACARACRRGWRTPRSATRPATAHASRSGVPRDVAAIGAPAR